MPPSFSLDFPFAYGQPIASALFRVEPEDFQVDEHLGFLPSGEGEHVFLHVWKRGENTAWVAERIAELAGVLVMDIGYCGRKDRHAVTTQWFSVYLPKQASELTWTNLNSETIKVLAVSRHHQKLRRGDHSSNRFQIRLRDVKTEDKELLQYRLEQVFSKGVPNYYGEQRFGNDGNNLQEAQAVLVEGKRIRDKQKRGLILSAARSYLFNQVLSVRVAANDWGIAMGGEPDSIPTGPLWGRGRSLSKDRVFDLEENALLPWKDWRNGLEHAGLAQERRALVLKPDSPSYSWNGNDLELNFSLGSGEFATTILREIAYLQTSVKTGTVSL